MVKICTVIPVYSEGKLAVETIHTEKLKQKNDRLTPKDGLKILLQLSHLWWRGRKK